MKCPRCEGRVGPDGLCDGTERGFEDCATINRLLTELREARAALTFDKLREVNVRRCEYAFHQVNEWTLSDWLMDVTGKLGDVAREVKTIRRSMTSGEAFFGGSLDHEEVICRMAYEAADVVIYLDLLCARAGVDLGAAVREKFDLVSRVRCPPGTPTIGDDE